MLCQYSSGCNNVGAYNCTKCGKMYCGMHTHFATTASTPIVCEDCQRIEHEVSEKERKSVRGCSCSVLLVSLLLFILGFIIDIVTSSPEHIVSNSGGAVLIVLGVIGFIIGGILFLMALG